MQPDLISSTATATSIGGQSTTATALNNYDLDTPINHKSIGLIKTKKKITTNNNKSRSGSESPSGDIGGESFIAFTF